jgi:hypothetical protein
MGTIRPIWGGGPPHGGAFTSRLRSAMPLELETDYLVVGAGAAGMAFTDALLSHSDKTITIVDRRHAPGGHWVDAYPYVRLHQPSTFYGVSSVPLGQDAIDAVGPNAGFYELAGADELRAYYERVMTRRFLSTGRVRYFPNCEYAGEHRFVSRLTGDSWQARVHRKLVDTTYLEGAIPATDPPPFTVADGVRCIPAGELARVSDRPERFVIIGAGKTALDACTWLLARGVAPSAIRWIKPREAWWLNRKFQQPHAMLPELYRGASIQLQAMAEARSVDELYARLESEKIFIRVARDVAPTMFRGAVVSEPEIDMLRQIEDVVRMGYVRRIDRDAIVLDGGSVPTHERTVHVHCASRALARPALCPIFEERRITVQPIMWGFACYQFAMLGVTEATIESNDVKNRLCPPIAYWDEKKDYLSAFLAGMLGDRARAAHPALAGWMKTTRLNPVSGLAAFADDPRVVDARDRIKRFAPLAVTNLATLLSG